MAQTSFRPSTRSSSFTPSSGENLSERSRCMTRIAQCTHITMTRVYNKDFRCALCLRSGSMGWLYRCTQDRESLIEEDKISQEDLDIYPPDQIITILNRQKQALEVAQNGRNKNGISLTDGLGLRLPTARGHDLCSSIAVSTSLIDFSPPNLWLPTEECQFKCCHACRPGLAERNYLSLSSVVNGKVPATALTGFGFHYHKKRPIALVKHVRNLGLRSNPPKSTKQYPLRIPTINYGIKPPPLRQGSAVFVSESPTSPFNDELNADTTFGQPSNAYDSTAMARSLNGEHDINGEGNANGRPIRREFEALAIHQRLPLSITTPCAKTTQATDASILKRPISPKTGLKRSPRCVALNLNTHEKA